MEAQTHKVIEGSRCPSIAALELVGVTSIPEDLIEAHKLAEIEKNPASLIWRIMQHLGGVKTIDKYLKWSGLTTATSFVISGACSIVLFLGLISSYIYMAMFGSAGYATRLYDFSSMWLTYSVPICITSFVLILIISKTMNAGFKINGPCSWYEFQWDPRQTDYAVPVFVKNTARSIQSVQPDAKFSISELRQNKEVLDPILYVHIQIPGNNSQVTHAVCVWDEEGNSLTL